MSELSEVMRRLDRIDKKMDQVEANQTKHREEFLVQITQMEASRKTNAAAISTIISMIVSLAVAFWSWLLHHK
jgi:DNA repair ATPase RecN